MDIGRLSLDLTTTPVLSLNLNKDHSVSERGARLPSPRASGAGLTRLSHGWREQGRGLGGHLPLTLARVQDELLIAPGADAQLVLRGVEDVQEQVALPGAVARDRAQVGIF